VGTSIICTTCACISGVLMAKFLSKLPMFRLAAIETVASAQTAEARKPAEEKVIVKEAATLAPMTGWGNVIIVAFLMFFAALFLRLVFPMSFGLTLSEADAKQGLFVRIVGAVSLLSIPFLLSLFPLYAALRRVKVYEEFVEGAKEGFDVAIRIIPFLLAMLVAIGMFRAAGGIDILSRWLAPVLHAVGFPVDLLPMVLLRPLSGSGTLGLFTELTKQFGPDSLIARTAGTIYGSTETTFYVLAVYFGSVAVRRTRYAVIAGLTADLVSVIVAIVVCRAVFG